MKLLIALLLPLFVAACTALPKGPVAAPGVIQCPEGYNGCYSD